MLNGGASADALVGGLDNDVYIVDNMSDIVIEAMEEGVDQVNASVSHALAANVENLMLTGGSISGTGNVLDNVITGTRIYDRATGEVMYGRIPEGSVVVSGNLPSADGKYSLYCAVIVKRVDAQTRAGTAINELVRD